MQTYQNIFVEMSRHVAQDHVSQLIHSSISTWWAKCFQTHYQTVSLLATETRVYKSIPIFGGLFYSRAILRYGPNYAFGFLGSYSFLFNTCRVVH